MMPANRTTATPTPDGWAVAIDGQPFTVLRAEGLAKPILHPVLGPGGVPMTRNYPMQQVPGEANDHPHHNSLWYTHGAVNGIDFWSEGEGRGTIIQDSVTELDNGDDGVAIATENRWVGPDGATVMTDRRLYLFDEEDSHRVIDIVVELHASHGEVVLGDTKEGTMGIRTHPSLRLVNDERRGVTTAAGRAVNSEGVTGADVWGKRARWVHYQGPIDGVDAGIAIFDHPANPRHPTWWHARDYGLVAANPFGINDFEKAGAGTGDMTIPAGESVRFHYRFLFHAGAAMAADAVEAAWKAWTTEDSKALTTWLGAAR